jgi:hypothetical protein
VWLGLVIGRAQAQRSRDQLVHGHAVAAFNNFQQHVLSGTDEAENRQESVRHPDVIIDLKGLPGDE